MSGFLVDLAEFLNARLNEDKDNIEGEIQLTLENLATDGLPTTREKLLTPDPPDYLPEFPRRLREVDAKRDIVRRCAACMNEMDVYPNGLVSPRAVLARQILMNVGAVDSDHPDYREEWKP